MTDDGPRPATSVPGADGWTTWAPRPALRPAFAQERAADGAAILRLSGTGTAALGGWRRDLGAVVPGRWYRVRAELRDEGLAHPRGQALARLRWTHDDEGCFPEYLVPVGRDGGWTRLEWTAEAPAGARGAVIELGLRWTSGGSASWRAVAFDEVPPTPPRPVRLATLHHRRRPSSGPAESIARIVDAVAGLAPGEVDLLCLPEGIATAGNDRAFAEVAEPIPGPLTATIGALARRLRAYVCVGAYERAGDLVFNTAALIGRDGALVGTYRKHQLPQNESDGGITPGDAFPVFATDLGRIGLMVCWDVQFADPARRLADAGAEIICLPIAGGSEVLIRARAIENHVHLVSSSYHERSLIIDPLGGIVAQADERAPVATARIDLARRHRQPWIGDFASAVRIERRAQG